MFCRSLPTAEVSGNAFEVQVNLSLFLFISHFTERRILTTLSLRTSDGEVNVSNIFIGENGDGGRPILQIGKDATAIATTLHTRRY